MDCKAKNGLSQITLMGQPISRLYYIEDAVTWLFEEKKEDAVTWFSAPNTLEELRTKNRKRKQQKQTPLFS